MCAYGWFRGHGQTLGLCITCSYILSLQDDRQLKAQLEYNHSIVSCTSFPTHAEVFQKRDCC